MLGEQEEPWVLVLFVVQFYTLPKYNEVQLKEIFQNAGATQSLLSQSRPLLTATKELHQLGSTVASVAEASGSLLCLSLNLDQLTDL